MSDVFVYNTEDVAKKATRVLSENIETFSLVSENDPILREPIPEFDFNNVPVNPIKFASSLTETCKKYQGYGLSANQCGFKYRVFVMGSNDEYVAFFNPKILEYSEEESMMVEGCLSFPMLALNIKRPSRITVEYQDYIGEIKTQTFSGLTARCFLHELDHLNGIVYTDVAKSLALKQGLKKRDKLKRLIKKAEKN